jgi:hypothetical protein
MLDEMKGCFDNLNTDDYLLVQNIVGWFHFRNGNAHDDGSCGDVRITFDQINDMAAYLIQEARRQQHETS